MRRCPPVTDTRSPSRRDPHAERLEPTFRVVTRGERLDARWSCPAVCSPASSTALFTCALGTSGA